MNYYEILGVSPKASDKCIHDAYRKLAKKYHPDVFDGDKEYAQEQMKIINEAYNTLIDTDKRRVYDTKINNDYSEPDNNEAEDDDTVSGNGSGEKNEDNTNGHIKGKNRFNYDSKTIPIIFKWKIIFLVLFFASMFENRIMLYIGLGLLAFRLIANKVEANCKLHGFKKFCSIVFCGFALLIAFGTFSIDTTDVSNETTQVVYDSQDVEDIEVETGDAKIKTETNDTNNESEALNDDANKITNDADTALKKETNNENTTENSDDNDKKKNESGISNRISEFIFGLAKDTEQVNKFEKQIRGLYSEYYPVYIKVDFDEKLISEKEISLYIDGDKVGILKDGQSNVYEMILKTGKHTMKISNGVWSDKEKFTIGEIKHVEQAPNYVIADIKIPAFSQKPKFSELDVNGEEEHYTYEDAQKEHWVTIGFMLMSNPVRIDHSDFVIGQHECRRVNDVNKNRHMTDNLDVWTWLDGTISVNLPNDMQKTVMEMNVSPNDVTETEKGKHPDSVVELNNKTLKAIFSASTLPISNNDGTIQITDVINEIDMENIIISNYKDEGIALENVRIISNDYNGAKVYKINYQYFESGEKINGTSIALIKNSVLARADFTSSASSLIDDIINSFNLNKQ